MQLIQSIDLGQGSRPVQFFYGIGLKACYITEYYSYTGSYLHFPSDNVVHVTHIQPLITFGLRIRLVSFGVRPMTYIQTTSQVIAMSLYRSGNIKKNER